MRQATYGVLLALTLLVGPASGRAEQADKSALIQELLVASGAADGLTPMMEKMVGPIADQLARLNPDRPEVGRLVRRMMTDRLIPALRRYEPEFLKASEALYASHFDAGDIAALLEFYRSPVGRKLVGAQVDMATEISLVTMTIMQRVMREALPGIVEDLRREGLKTEI